MLQHAICCRQHFCCSLQRCSKILHFVNHHATRPWPRRHCTAGMSRGRGGPGVRLMQMTHSECASPWRTGCCSRGIIARTVISFIPRASAWCHPCNVNCIYSGTALAINFFWQSWKNLRGLCHGYLVHFVYMCQLCFLKAGGVGVVIKSVDLYDLVKTAFWFFWFHLRLLHLQ